MNLTDRISKNHLTLKQSKTIESILEELDSSAFLSGHEICDKYNTSFSSLTRIAKALDYSGFPELKKDIEQEYRNQFSPSVKAENFIAEVKDQSVLSHTMLKEQNMIEKLLLSIDEDLLTKIAESIHHSKRVFIVGVGFIEPIVQKLTSGLNLLNKNAYSLTTLGFSQQLEMYSPNEHDLVIMMSMNKELVELQSFSQILKDKNIPSLLISDKKTSGLRSKLKYIIHAPSQTSAMLNNLTSFLIITNLIESLVFSLDKQSHLSKIKSIEEQWETLPLFLS